MLWVQNLSVGQPAKHEGTHGLVLGLKQVGRHGQTAVVASQPSVMMLVSVVLVGVARWQRAIKHDDNGVLRLSVYLVQLYIYLSIYHSRGRVDLRGIASINFVMIAIFYPSIHQSIHPSTHPPIHLPTYLPTYLPINLTIYLSIHLPYSDIQPRLFLFGSDFQLKFWRATINQNF